MSAAEFAPNNEDPMRSNPGATTWERAPGPEALAEQTRVLAEVGMVGLEGYMSDELPVGAHENSAASPVAQAEAALVAAENEAYAVQEGVTDEFERVVDDALSVDTIAGDWSRLKDESGAADDPETGRHTLKFDGEAVVTDDQGRIVKE